MSAPATIAVIGTGYVGLTTGACLAHLGHHVICADIDATKIESLQRGEIPIVEAGLAEIVADARAAGRLEFVLGSAVAADRADVVFLCVPTPQGDDGSADLSYIQAAAAEVGPTLRAGAVVVNKSTVPVGSTRVVERVIRRDDIAVVSNPEFLREGTAVHDFLHPDRVVIGAVDRTAADRVAELYRSLDTDIIVTDPASAETIKYAANGFLAMKISFVNAIAAMCEAVGADVADVVHGIGSDSRIGPAFLKPGPGWGGSCFPKDSRALVKIAQEHGYNFTMMRGVIDVNDEQRSRMVHKVVHALGGDRHALHGATIAALGLTFKAGTDDLRDSPALAIVAELRRSGAVVRGYDPTAVPPIAPHRTASLGGIELCASAVEAVTGADVTMILTEWPELAELDMAKAAEVMRGRTVVDTRNLLDPVHVTAAGLTYDGVGRR
ncbi:MAG: UDP-glucose/GDP-mannose dehydrogenase family protein [Ilumatobacteraceae bacterium]